MNMCKHVNTHMHITCMVPRIPQCYNHVPLTHHLRGLQLNVGPTSFSVVKVTLYVPSSVMLKLQLVSDGVRSEHPSADIGAGPSTSTVTASIGGVYTDNGSLLYWIQRNT